ncbi:hypothetical protein pb186bvf_007147 [Paramecium bursaria]
MNIDDFSRYKKIESVRSMQLHYSPIRNTIEPLLSAREDPQKYAQNYKIEFRFQTAPILQNQTNAFSVVESSKAQEQSKILDDSIMSSQSSKRKIILKSRVSQRSAQSIQSNKKQLNKIELEFREATKNNYGILLSVQDNQYQLDFQQPQDNRIVWGQQNIDIGKSFTLIIQQQNEKRVSVYQMDVNNEQNLRQDIQLKYLKTIINASILIEFQ